MSQWIERNCCDDTNQSFHIIVELFFWVLDEFFLYSMFVIICLHAWWYSEWWDICDHANLLNSEEISEI